MFTYGSLRPYIPFRIRNRQAYGPVFYISLVIWDPIHLFGLLLNREIGLIVHLFDIIVRHPPDNSNRSNWMSDSDLYDMTEQ